MKDFKEMTEIYVEMVEEEIPVIEEKSSSHAEGKEVIKLLKKAVGMGLVSVTETGKGYMVKSLVDDSQQLIHKGGRSFHPLRRYLKNLKRPT